MQNPIYLLRRIVAGKKREAINVKLREGLVNKEFSVFSSSCIGGVVCSDMGVRFNSPTVNLFIKFPDFLKMMENLPYYMSLTPTRAPREGHLYPVIMVGDVKVYCVHYHLYKTAINKWVSRAKRVNYDDIRIILGGLPWGHEDLMSRFEALPYKKLIVTTYDKAPDDDYVVKVKEKIGWTGISFNFKNFKGERFYDKYVDFVSFFNN